MIKKLLIFLLTSIFLIYFIFPFVFKTTASETIKRLNKEIEIIDAKGSSDS